MASFEKSSYTNLAKYKEAKRNERKRRKERQLVFIDELKQPCLFCGENNKDEIQLHHVNATEKKFDPTSGSHSLKSIAEEVKKCWCLCKECHTKLHQRLCDPLPSAYDTL